MCNRGTSSWECFCQIQINPLRSAPVSLSSPPHSDLIRDNIWITERERNPDTTPGTDGGGRALLPTTGTPVKRYSIFSINIFQLSNNLSFLKYVFWKFWLFMNYFMKINHKGHQLQAQHYCGKFIVSVFPLYYVKTTARQWTRKWL